MRDIEVAKFVSGSTNETCEVTDGRVTMILSFGSKKDGKLTLPDFLEFYRNSCIEKGNLATVRNNLRNHGFRQDLQMNPKNGSEDNILQVRPLIHDMPRFKLQQNEAFFQTLFQLLSFQTEIYKEASKMLRMLNTNLKFFWTLLWLDNPPEFITQKFTWASLFKADNLHETMYVLEIVESFLVNDFQMLQ